MLAAISKYLKPLDIVDQQSPAHEDFLGKLFEQGILLACARQNPAVGGVLLAHNVTKEQFTEILDQDPFVTHGLAEYEIIDFPIAKSVDQLAGIK